MANAFDQFDAPAGNAFDRFDAVEEKPKKGGFLQGIGNVAAGGLRGAGSIGATLLTPIDLLMGNTKTIGNPERRRAMDDALGTMGAETDSFGYGVGKLTGEVLGTMGIGGAAANVIGRAPGVATRAGPFLDALRTGGFSVGNATGKAAMGARVAGGSAGGALAAGAVNPDDAGIGAVVGGAFPLVAQGAGVAGRAIGRGYRSAMMPKDARVAEKLSVMLQRSPDDLMRAMQAPAPGNIPGYRATVPQILQMPETSQLQRSLKTAGTNAIGTAERAQQDQFRAALERVAPADLSLQDAAARAGGALQDFAKPARATATENVRRSFDSVDPFNETALFLPIEDMQKAVSKFLGAGTFGTGGSARDAVATATDVGTEFLPAIKATTKKVIGKGQTLEQAVRAAGGLKPGSSGLGGEMADLGRKQSGTTGLINAKSGKSADLLAAQMHQRGFISDPDPALLIETLRNGGGRGVYANDFTDNAFAGMAERAMGDLPEAERIAKTVPFATVQNLRSSIGEAAERASMKGANKEAAALRDMVGSIDSRINRAAGGSVQKGEFFPQDIAAQYREALGLHADKMKRFETGPQMGMFRQGGDGQASIQGAEIPSRFFSGKRSQVEDVKALKTLVGNRGDLMDEMKRYAMTEAGSTANSAGELTTKYTKWLLSRSGANRELFSKTEQATLKEVGEAVTRSFKAENLGRVSGSDTAQKLAGMQSLGLLDNRFLDIAANRIPVLGSFTGPMLSGLRQNATQSQNNTLAGLLANPDEFSRALGAIPSNNPGMLTNAMRALGPTAHRAAPVVSAQ
jgi:hypothetical protein